MKDAGWGCCRCCGFCYSLILLIVYASFVFASSGHKELEIVCLSNNYDFHPIPYEDEEELETLKESDWAINMTEKFQTVLMYGFISNTIYLCYLIFRALCCSRNTKKLYSNVLTLLNVGLNAMWLIQFWMLVFVRYSFPGRVCSGDFHEYMEKEEKKEYAPLYLSSEGAFF